MSLRGEIEDSRDQCQNSRFQGHSRIAEVHLLGCTTPYALSYWGKLSLSARALYHHAVRIFPCETLLFRSDIYLKIILI